jgi:hypothetical protein
LQIASFKASHSTPFSWQLGIESGLKTASWKQSVAIARHYPRNLLSGSCVPFMHETDAERQTYTSDKTQEENGQSMVHREMVELGFSVSRSSEYCTHSDPYRASCNGDQGWLQLLQARLARGRLGGSSAVHQQRNNRIVQGGGHK